MLVETSARQHLLLSLDMPKENAKTSLQQHSYGLPILPLLPIHTTQTLQPQVLLLLGILRELNYGIKVTTSIFYQYFKVY